MEKIKEYQQISADVWKMFVKYLPEGADVKGFAEDVHRFDQKYKDSDKYKFMQSLLKVFFDELRRVKE